MTTIILMKYPPSKLDELGSDSQLPDDADLTSTKEGRALANAAATNLLSALQGRYTVWSGPAPRCVEPAREMASVLGADIEVREELDERKMLTGKSGTLVSDLRSRQERGFIDPSRPEGGSLETPYSHRIRVELWLSGLLAGVENEEIAVVVSHGAVIEHLHSSLHHKPAGAMNSTFSFCAPGHAHVWSSVELPDGKRIWSSLASNSEISRPESMGLLVRGVADLKCLSLEMATDPRFEGLLVDEDDDAKQTCGAYYIR